MHLYAAPAGHRPCTCHRMVSTFHGRDGVALLRCMRLLRRPRLIFIVCAAASLFLGFILIAVNIAGGPAAYLALALIPAGIVAMTIGVLEVVAVGACCSACNSCGGAASCKACMLIIAACFRGLGALPCGISTISYIVREVEYHNYLWHDKNRPSWPPYPPSPPRYPDFHRYGRSSPSMPAEFGSGTWPSEPPSPPGMPPWPSQPPFPPAGSLDTRQWGWILVLFLCTLVLCINVVLNCVLAKRLCELEPANGHARVANGGTQLAGGAIATGVPVSVPVVSASIATGVALGSANVPTASAWASPPSAISS